MMLYMTGARHFNAGVDDRGLDVSPENRREPLGIVDAVLQRKNGRLPSETAGERFAGRLGALSGRLQTALPAPPAR